MNRRSRRRWSAALLLGALLGAAWWLMPADRRPCAKLGPRPGQTDQARTRWLRPPPPQEPVVAAEEPVAETPEIEAVPEVSIVVFLPHVDVWLPLDPEVLLEQDVHPEEFWPGLDEAPWPQLWSSEAMQDLATRAREDGYSKKLLGPARAFVAAAEDDGLLDDPVGLALADPWAALVAMQAARVDALLAHEAAGGFGFLAMPWDEPAVDLGPSIAIAEAVEAAWPDEPVADYARLQLLEAFSDPKTVSYDPEQSLSLVREMLDSEDVVVSEAAAQRLAVLELDPNAVSDPEGVLRDLERSLPGLSADGRFLVTSFAMKVAHDAPEAADRSLWAGRMAEAAEACGDGDRCTEWTTDDTTAALMSRMRADEGIAATSWIGAVRQSIHACDGAETVQHDVALRGRYDGGWSWSSDDAPGALLACLRSWRSEPTPEAAVVAEVTVYAMARGARETWLSKLAADAEAEGVDWDFRTGWGRELAWMMASTTD